MLTRKLLTDPLRIEHDLRADDVLSQKLASFAVSSRFWPREGCSEYDIFYSCFYVLPLLDRHSNQCILLCAFSGEGLVSLLNGRKVPQVKSSWSRPRITERRTWSAHYIFACPSGAGIADVFAQTSCRFSRVSHWNTVGCPRIPLFKTQYLLIATKCSCCKYHWVGVSSQTLHWWRFMEQCYCLHLHVSFASQS